jgi:putative flippase GtrA
MRGKGYRLRTQGVIFGVVGLSGTVLNTCLVYVLHGLVRRPLPVAAALASEPAVLNNYLWNDRWTFGRRDPSVRRFMRFNLSSLRGVAITTGATSALVGGVPYQLALLVGVAASALPCPMERRVRTRWW